MRYIEERDLVKMGVKRRIDMLAEDIEQARRGSQDKLKALEAQSAEIRHRLEHALKVCFRSSPTGLLSLCSRSTLTWFFTYLMPCPLVSHSIPIPLPSLLRVSVPAVEPTRHRQPQPR